MNDSPDTRDDASGEVPTLDNAPDCVEEAGRTTEHGRARSWWKLAAAWGGTLVVTAGGAVAVTLLATHNSAVRENFIAYINGLSNGYDAGWVDGHESGWFDGLDANEIGDYFD